MLKAQKCGVLQGAKLILKNFSPDIIIEWIDVTFQADNTNKEEFISFFSSYGYYPYTFTSKGLSPYSLGQPQETINIYFSKNISLKTSTMKRIKEFKYLLLPLVVAVLIFFIPFSWLKPGEMDLGGDNSRLYFYDPIAYLVGQSLYSVSHSGLGGENLSYFGIPFFLLLAVVKSLVRSPTTLISIFHGFNMSLGFFRVI